MWSDVAKRLGEAIRAKDGALVAKFFDIQHLEKNKGLCDKLVVANAGQDLGQDLWMEAFSFLLRVPLQTSEMDKFNIYNEASAPLIRNFKDISPALVVPCIKSIARSLRYFAANADYNESVNQMQKLLRLAPQRTANESALLSVVNELMAVYFRRNNVKQAQNLLKSVEKESQIDFSLFPVAEVVCFHFNKGRIYAIHSNVRLALENLTLALKKCPMRESHNRRLILAYLIPVQLCCGVLPSAEEGLLGKYQLEVFADFAKAIADADLRLFDNALQTNQLLFVKLGLYQLMIVARRVVLYRVIQMVHHCYGDFKIPISAFQSALSKFESYTVDETESIIAVLIENKMIKAYIHHGLHIVVFANKQDPFIPIGPEIYT